MVISLCILKLKGTINEHTTTSHILYVITIFFFGDLMGPIGMEHQSIIFPTKNGYYIKIVFAFINLIHLPNCYNISSLIINIFTSYEIQKVFLKHYYIFITIKKITFLISILEIILFHRHPVMCIHDNCYGKAYIVDYIIVSLTRASPKRIDI